MQGVNPWIEVDGGVSPSNAYQLIEVGANALVAGSAVFGAKDYAEGELPGALPPPSPLTHLPAQSGPGFLWMGSCKLPSSAWHAGSRL